MGYTERYEVVNAIAVITDKCLCVNKANAAEEEPKERNGVQVTIRNLDHTFPRARSTPGFLSLVS